MVAAALYADSSNLKMLVGCGESSPTAATIASKALVDVTSSTSKPMQILPSINLSPISSIAVASSTSSGIITDTNVAARVVCIKNEFSQEILPSEKDSLFSSNSSANNTSINAIGSIVATTATIGSTTSNAI